jgi:hypothetical protein
MYARAIDDAALRLRELRREEWEDLGLAGLALGLSVTATQFRPAFALPLFLGGLVVGALGIRALYRRWDLVDRLLGEREAYVIPEIRGHASRMATIDCRRRMAASIRSTLAHPGVLVAARLHDAAAELDALAGDLDDDGLVLEPARAVACLRLLNEYSESPLLNPRLPAEDLHSQVSQIRSGFTQPYGRAA